MSFEGKKPMATALADPAEAIYYALQRGCSDVEGVLSIQTRWLCNVLNVWIGVREDDDIARGFIYDLEDKLLDKFRNISVDFHVVTIPEGRRLEDYISEASTIFSRIA
jgi:hypothetical protein